MVRVRVRVRFKFRARVKLRSLQFCCNPNPVPNYHTKPNTNRNTYTNPNLFGSILRSLSIMLSNLDASISSKALKSNPTSKVINDGENGSVVPEDDDGVG
jgi:hypothetical protein